MTIINHLGIKRETDKAILVACQIGYCSSIGRKVNIWFPKSRVAIVDDSNIEVEGWLARAKLDEYRSAGVTPWFE